MAKKIATLVIVVIAMAALAWLAVSDWNSSYQAIKGVESVSKNVEAMSQEERDALAEQAFAYNATLIGFGSDNPQVEESYDHVLDVGDEGEMCWIEIPAPAVLLPVFHGDAPGAMEKGASHATGTAVPIGGNGNHVLIAGYEGYERNMFDAIRTLTRGDKVIVHVLGRNLAYRVDGVETVASWEVGDTIVPDPEKDCLTLMSQPYNSTDSRRFLVHCSATSDDAIDMVADEGAGPRIGHTSIWKMVFTIKTIPLFIATIVLVAGLIFQRYKRKRRKQVMRTIDRAFLDKGDEDESPDDNQD